MTLTSDFCSAPPEAKATLIEIRKKLKKVKKESSFFICLSPAFFIKTHGQNIFSLGSLYQYA
jgi:hypothetical protein